MEEKKDKSRKILYNIRNCKEKDKDLFSLAILSKSSESIGMMTVFEKEDEENQNESQKIAQNFFTIWN